MRDNERRPVDSRSTEREQPREDARRPAPGKVTRTSKLPGRAGPPVQRQAHAAESPASPSQARTAWEQTQDPWMDAAHRGLAAFAGQDPVQAHGNIEHEDPASVHRAAADGIRTSGGPLPHAARIQQSFGSVHDLGGVRAHVGGAAAEASERMGADA